MTGEECQLPVASRGPALDLSHVGVVSRRTDLDNRLAAVVSEGAGPHMLRSTADPSRRGLDCGSAIVASGATPSDHDGWAVVSDCAQHDRHTSGFDLPSPAAEADSRAADANPPGPAADIVGVCRRWAAVVPAVTGSNARIAGCGDNFFDRSLSCTVHGSPGGIERRMRHPPTDNRSICPKITKESRIVTSSPGILRQVHPSRTIRLSRELRGN